VLRDLERFPDAYALPSQWPTNAWQQEAARRSVEQLMNHHGSRLLEPIHAISASKLLLQSDLPEQLPSNLNNACRSLATQVLEVLESFPPATAGRPDVDRMPGAARQAPATQFSA